MLVRFIKNWTLPLAMLAGTLGYFFFADIPFVEPAKPYVNGLVAFLTPLLIFSQQYRNNQARNRLEQQ